MGNPIISFNIPGPRDYILEPCGYLIKMRDYKSFIYKILYYIDLFKNRKESYKNIVLKCKLLSKYYNLSYIVKKYYNIINTIVFYS